MRNKDRQLGEPDVLFKATKAEIEALTGLESGAHAYATDQAADEAYGTYNGSVWTWGQGSNFDMATAIHDATTASLTDTSEIGFWDSVTSALRKITWSNIKATLKTYFDTVYSALGHSHDHTTLSNIGTNTHAQIDTHIASTTNPHFVTAAQAGAVALAPATAAASTIQPTANVVALTVKQPSGGTAAIVETLLNSGVALFKVLQNGNIQVGNTTPSSPAGFSPTLYVAGNDPAITLNKGGQVYEIGAGSTGGTTWLALVAGTSRIRIYNSNSTIYLNGIVGIGTETPSSSAKLDVIGNVFVDTGSVFDFYGSTRARGVIGYAGSGAYGYFMSPRNLLLQANSTAGGGDIIFAGGSATLGSGELMRLTYTGGKLGINTSSPSAKLHVVNSADTVVLTLKKYSSQTVNILEAVTSGDVLFFGISATGDIISNTSPGIKIGTATSQLLGFWGATPVDQATTAITGAAHVSGGGTALTDTDTWDGYTFGKVVASLRRSGHLA